ncbi:MAG: hypothetical protein RIR33_1150 [Pseudomonadota bacterium]|jgi:hypothetical protein
MEHFSAVQSIIRAGLAGDRAALEKQVARLRDRLSKDGSSKEAETIDRLLKAAAEAPELRPSRVEVSRALVTGEAMTPTVLPPIDRETGARLCSVEFPSSLRTSPEYDETVRETIGDILAEWSNPSRLRDVGVEPTRTLLIFGPPGSGKTLTAHYIAHRLDLPLVVARIDGLISSFLGTTARNIANLFDFANRYRCVLLLDEFDALAKQRDDPQEVGEIKRVVNTLLQNLDSRRDIGITIAITNHDRLLDPAIWRRFEAQLHIGEPNDASRRELVRRFLAPIDVEEDLAELFAYCLSGRSGADIQRICNGVKRSLALGHKSLESPSLVSALHTVLSRMPVDESGPAAELAKDVHHFISYAANDDSLKLTQQVLGDLAGMKQPDVSKLKKARHLAREAAANHPQEPVHAE